MNDSYVVSKNFLKKFEKAIRMKRENVNKVYPHLEEEIKNNPFQAALYASRVIKDCWPEAEECISQDAEASNLYAQSVIRGRWKKGEEAIKTNSYEIVDYIQYAMRKRWQEGERALLKNSINDNNHYCVNQYSREVLRKRWKRAEKEIIKIKNARSLFAYCWGVNYRWKEAEDIILNSGDLETIYDYYCWVFNDGFSRKRWKKVEDIFVKSSYYASLYAIYTLEKRWLKAEREILQGKLATKYIEEFIVPLKNSKICVNKYNNLHRVDGPALILPSGDQYFYKNGINCGPATKNTKDKNLYGRYFPAVILSSGYMDWRNNKGLLHRDDGPAVITKDKIGRPRYEYWLNGNRVTKTKLGI